MSAASRRRVKAFGGLLLGAGLFFAACARPAEPQANVSVEHEVAPDPPRMGQATLTLRVTDEAGRPLSGARVSVEGNMTHAGMQPVFGEAKESGPGRYECPLEFTMGGDWVVTVRVTLPDGRKIEREFNVRGVKSG